MRVYEMTVYSDREQAGLMAGKLLVPFSVSITDTETLLLHLDDARYIDYNPHESRLSVELSRKDFIVKDQGETILVAICIGDF